MGFTPGELARIHFGLMPPPQGSSSIFVDETTGGTLALPAVPGFSIVVPPGAATFPDGSKDGIITLNSVDIQRPIGPTTMFTLSISPPGVLFDPPAPITLPNLDWLPPGDAVTMFSFDDDIKEFVLIGPGTVSDDGSVIVSDPGVGIIKSG